MKRSVVVVGGGITGLATAYYLKQWSDRTGIPLHCTVLEQSSRFGGKILTRRESGFVLECGPDALLARKRDGIDLIRELGLESDLVGTSPNGMKTYIARRGKLLSIPPGTNMGIPTQMMPFAVTPLLSVFGKARALLDLLLPRRKSKADESVGHFLRRRLGAELVQNVAEPLLAGIYAGRVDELSLQATYPMFADMEARHRSLILASLAMRSGAHKPTTSPGSSARPHANSPAIRSVFVTLKSGLSTLTERLYDSLHDWAALKTEAEALSVVRTPEGGYELSVRTVRETMTLSADAVVLAVPAPAAATILKQILPEADQLNAIPYVSTATVLLAYPESAMPQPFDASGFVVPRSEQLVMTACTWMTTKWPHTTPDGYILVRCYVGRSGQSAALELSDDQLIDRIRVELRELLGLDGKPWFGEVTRWDNSRPQYSVGHVALIDSVEDALSRRAPGVWVAGEAYRGIGVPGCIGQGKETAGRVAAYFDTIS